MLELCYLRLYSELLVITWCDLFCNCCSDLWSVAGFTLESEFLWIGTAASFWKKLFHLCNQLLSLFLYFLSKIRCSSFDITVILFYPPLQSSFFCYISPGHHSLLRFWRKNFVMGGRRKTCEVFGLLFFPCCYWWTWKNC